MPPFRPSRPVLASVLSLVAVGIPNLLPLRARAEEAPKAITKVVEVMETAANERDLDELLDRYAEDFRHADGLDVDTLGDNIQELWMRYPQLTYDVELVNWQKTADGFEYETITRIAGSGERDGRTLQLQATLQSRQQMRKGRIVSQAVLAEQTRVDLGDRQPDLRVNLPETVAPGDQYSFDIIALDPLEAGALLGAAQEEPVSSASYLSNRALDLNILPAGGLYLVGVAPEEPGDLWLSAAIVQPGGITFIGRRLRV
ncbi:MAG: nuclear transport factor 2 family protein, partial [Cyanobacteria bacterium J06641_5]